MGVLAQGKNFHSNRGEQWLYQSETKPQEGKYQIIQLHTWHKELMMAAPVPQWPWGSLIPVSLLSVIHVTSLLGWFQLTMATFYPF